MTESVHLGLLKIRIQHSFRAWYSPKNVFASVVLCYVKQSRSFLFPSQVVNLVFISLADTAGVTEDVAVPTFLQETMLMPEKTSPVKEKQMIPVAPLLTPDNQHLTSVSCNRSREETGLCFDDMGMKALILLLHLASQVTPSVLI